MVRAFCGTLAWRRSMLRLYVHGVHHRPSLYTFLGIIVIPKARHPDVRKASARSHQRASRTEGSCVCLSQTLQCFLKCHKPKTCYLLMSRYSPCLRASVVNRVLFSASPRLRGEILVLRGELWLSLHFLSFFHDHLAGLSQGAVE